MISSIQMNQIEVVKAHGMPAYRITSGIVSEKGSKTAQGLLRSCNQKPVEVTIWNCLLYTSPSPRDQRGSRMPSSA